MNSIERVKRTLAGEDVDRVPLGFYVVDCDTIEKVIGRQTYVRNKIKSAIALADGRRDEVAESYKKDTVDFFRKVELCDIITAKEAAVLPPKDYTPVPMKKINDDYYEDANGRVFQVSHLSNELVCVKDPIEDSREYKIEDYSQDKPIEPVDESIFEAFDYMVSQLGDSRFILGPGCFGIMPMPGGMEKGLLLYAMNPELIQAMIDFGTRWQRENIKYFVRPGQHGMLCEKDLGTTRASLISPAMFRQMCFPAMKEQVGRIKGFGQYAFLHSCGNTWDLIDMFIEAGFDCYQSLQTDAGLDIDKLYERFDNKLTFWGGIAVEILITGTMDDVRRNVREAVEKAKRAKAIVGPSHSIAYGTPYDNFMAMLDEFEKTSAY